LQNAKSLEKLHSKKMDLHNLRQVPFPKSWPLFKWLDKNEKLEKLGLASKSEKGNAPVSLVRSFI